MIGRTASEFSSIRPTTYSLFQKYNARSATYNSEQDHNIHVVICTKGSLNYIQKES